MPFGTTGPEETSGCHQKNNRAAEPAITEEQKKKLFMPFARSRRDGTGIGLSVAKYVMDAMGGSIEVISEYGAGTAVTMRFPLERTACEAEIGRNQEPTRFCPGSDL